MKKLIPLILSLAAFSAQSRELPAWQQLEFEQQALWVTARSKVSVAAISDGGAHPIWRLHAESSVAGNLERVAVEFDADSGRAIYRSRYSQGKNRRHKEYRYQRNAVTRLRREPPAADPTAAPGDWPITSERQLSLPAQLEGSVVSTPWLLLLLAGDALAHPDTAARFIVHTDFNYYEVTARLTGTEELEVKTPAGTVPAAGTHLVKVVGLQIRPIHPLADKPDFMLLGLSDDISILYDSNNHLPLQLRGRAPKIGRTHIDLKAAVLRQTPL